MRETSKRKWAIEQRRRRQKARRGRPAALPTLGDKEPILVWIASWKEYPADLDHPFNIRAE